MSWQARLKPRQEIVVNSVAGGRLTIDQTRGQCVKGNQRESTHFGGPVFETTPRHVCVCVPQTGAKFCSFAFVLAEPNAQTFKHGFAFIEGRLLEHQLQSLCKLGFEAVRCGAGASQKWGMFQQWVGVGEPMHQFRAHEADGVALLTQMGGLPMQIHRSS